MDLSSFDNLSSIDMTTQLAMMVIMMTQSKGGQLTSHIIIFLTGLVGVNRNREVGPLSSGSFSFFFFLMVTSDQVLSESFLIIPFGQICCWGTFTFFFLKTSERVHLSIMTYSVSLLSLLSFHFSPTPSSILFFKKSTSSPHNVVCLGNLK